MPRRNLVELPTASRVAWQDVLEEFILAKEAEGKRPRTIHDYRFHVERFFKHFPQAWKSYDTLRKCVLKYFTEEAAPSTRNKRLAHLKAFFEWCVREKYLPANPCAGLKRVKDEGQVRHISLEAVQKLLKAPDKKSYAGLRDYCMLLLLLDCGLRPGEMYQLRPEDVNLEAREVHIRPGVAKTRVGRTLPISPLTAQAIARFLQVRPKWWSEDVPLFASENGRQLANWYWPKRFKQYCKEAGVSASPYCLRHTAAIELLRNGADAFTVQRVLGHSTLEMTKRYVKLSQEDVKQAHEKASPVQKLAQLGKRANRRLN